jgi:hypothetical protein
MANLKVSAQEAAKIRAGLKKAVRGDTVQRLELARLLYHLIDGVTPGKGAQDVPLWMAWGYMTAEGYVEAELGISFRTAQHLRRVWYTFMVWLKGRVSLDVLKKVGISKLRHLTALVTPENVVELCQQAQHLTCADIEALAVRSARQQRADDEPIDPLQVMQFHLTPDERVVCEQALRIAGRRFRSLRPGARRGHLLALLLEEIVNHEPPEPPPHIHNATV